MYEAMDLLHWHIQEVEKSFLSIRPISLPRVDIYDTTTASFAIDEEDEDTEDASGYRKYGHSQKPGPGPPDRGGFSGYP